MFTAQKMKFSMKDFFSKLRIWSHLLKKFLMENVIIWCNAFLNVVITARFYEHEICE